MKKVRNMPLGIQSFREIRRAEYGYVYVDKSRFIWKLARTSWPYFLHRPRRFGKSLFLSMLRSYFLGEKHLFEGLEIEKIKQEEESEWKSYPVLCLDLTGPQYTSEEHLVERLNNNIKRWEKEFDIVENNCANPSDRFENIIREIYEKRGEQVVILIDEYDAPLVSTLADA